MQAIRPAGPEGASRKYGLLTALAVQALAGDKPRLVLRLMALVTARYNWQRDELAVGQAEIARLWAVDDRTVKRDMARLQQRLVTAARRCDPSLAGVRLRAE